MMDIVHTINDLRKQLNRVRREGKTIGFVPTMGALHAGHMALVEHSKNDNDYTVISIFVNPTQFGPTEDFEKYPRTLESDAEKCREAGVDVVFAPSVAEMYPANFHTHVDVDTVTGLLEGMSRPGHFQGVTTVVLKLFNIVQPHRAYFGMKDYQQLLVIRKMVHDLNMNVDVVAVPTVREDDGLAMSSRNAYLNPQERQAALVLYRVFETAKSRISEGERDGVKLRSDLEEMIHAEPLAEIDYVAVADPETLEPVVDIVKPVLVALAVKIGATRLIDNALIEL